MFRLSIRGSPLKRAGTWDASPKARLKPAQVSMAFSRDRPRLTNAKIVNGSMSSGMPSFSECGKVKFRKVVEDGLQTAEQSPAVVLEDEELVGEFRIERHPGEELAGGFVVGDHVFGFYVERRVRKALE